MFSAINVDLDIKSKTPLEMANFAAKSVSSLSSQSLPEYTSPTRLAPVVLVDKKLRDMNEDMTKALLQTLLSIYTAHYLRAIHLDIAGAHAIQILDKFATDRDIMRSLGSSSYLTEGMPFLGMEAYDRPKHSLPRDWTSVKREFGTENLITINEDDVDRPDFSAEALSFKDSKGADVSINKTKADDLGSDSLQSAGMSKDTIATNTEDSNLAVGKLIEVRMTTRDAEGKSTGTIGIPIQATLVPSMISPNDIITITQYNDIDKSMKGRWHAMRSGQIRFARDYLLNLDLIEQDRAALIADKTGTLLKARNKRLKNIIAALASGRASPNSVSSMMVVSKDTAAQMEMAMNGKKLRSARVRQEYFKGNVLMMLVVVDPVMERFTIYQRGIADAGDYTFADIKQNNKKAGGVDIEAVLKAYKLGDAVSL